ncbi:MAG: hypothetical protein ABI425_05800 [Patescibacteria group bacterium]
MASTTTAQKFTLKEFSISEILSTSWHVFKDNWKELAIFIIVYLLAVQVPMMLVNRVLSRGPLLSLLRLVLSVWNVYVGLGSIKYMLAFIRGQKPEIAKIFDNASEFVPFLIMYLRFMLVIFLGMIAFIIPGIYFSFKYAYVLILVADGKAAGSEAFVMSGQMTEGRKLTLFLYGIVSCFLVLVGMIAFVIPGLIAATVVGLGGMLTYQYLLDHKSSVSKAA